MWLCVSKSMHMYGDEFTYEFEGQKRKVGLDLLARYYKEKE